MKPRCFIVCPIGSPGTQTRRRSDIVFQELIAPVVEQRGFEPVRADMIAEPGVISSQIIKRLVDAHLVVADLTEGNANVFYELAIRHATNRPCVCIIEQGERIPFDIAAYRVLTITSTETEALRSARQTLDSLIEAAQVPGGADSPITAALGSWRLAFPERDVDRELIDSVILSYLHLSFIMGPREDLPEDRRCDEAREVLGRLESQLHLLTNRLGIPPPNEFRELEKAHWKAARGEP